jgi:hypothetical protein
MANTMNRSSLQDVVDRTPCLVDYFYNDTLAPHFRARTGLTATFVPQEFPTGGTSSVRGGKVPYFSISRTICPNFS